ncbi:MAG: HAMP domain-containing histidine kinase [Elusimicrobia bacterium]|nr:HAMP domain-containing histidine kinase [Elusimicrobiota bacterium]
MPDHDDAPGYAYESVFCIFLAALAFLGREQACWAFPQVLYLLIALLSLNLAAGYAMRRRPGAWVSAAAAMGNCALITAILHCSGGRASPLWVLYLLPVFTAAIFLGTAELVWISAGAVGFNISYCFLESGNLDAAVAMDAGLRTAVLALAGAVTRLMADRERQARGQVERQRLELDALLAKTESRAASDEPSRQLAEVGLLTAGVLHDLQTPLTVILGFSELGLHGADPEARKSFERIRKAGLVCRDIVSQVLAAAGPRPAEPLPCDLRETLLETIRMCESVFDHKGVSLHVRASEERILVAGAPTPFQRLFLNLLTNAAQATKRGGLLEVSLALSANAVRVFFDDDGPGLDDAFLQRLGKPFSTGKAAEGGTGIGLYVCRGIARAHGGELTAENRPQGGARFTVRLPLANRARVKRGVDAAQVRASTLRP